MQCGRSSAAKVVDVGGKHSELNGINIGLVLHSLAVSVPCRGIGRDGSSSFERFQVVLKARPRQLFAAFQDDSPEDLAGTAGAVQMQVTQDGRVSPVSEDFDGCLNLLRMAGLDETRHGSILPDCSGGSESQNQVHR